MADPTKASSFWQTLPGILTAAAALVTALAGGYVALRQVGSPEPPDAAGETRLAPTETGGSAAAPSGAPLPAETPAPPTAGAWADASAVLRREDGDELTVDAATFTHCGSPGLSLRSGQQIPFERMRSFEITRAPAADVGSVVVTLDADGRTVQGRIDLGCMFRGSNDLGEVTGYLMEVRRMDFRR